MMKQNATEPKSADPIDRIQSIAADCVKCGVCLPQCPTYNIHLVESESPRGRISIANAIAKSKISASAAAAESLDHCLQCGNCVRACPSEVDFFSLLNLTQQAGLSNQRLTFRRAALRAGLRFMTLSRIGAKLIAAVPIYFFPKRTWLSRFASAIHAQKKILSLTLHQNNDAEDAPYAILFQSCASSVFERDTLNAVSAFGAKLKLPMRNIDACCGALAKHDGDLCAAVSAKSRAQNKLENLFSRVPKKRSEEVIGNAFILSTLSGCQTEIANTFPNQRTMDVCEWANAQIAAQAEIYFELKKNREWNVAWLIPCTQRSLRDAIISTRQMIQRIKGVRIFELSASPHCCGAGGMKFLDYSETSDALLQYQIERIKSLNIDLVITSNLGCRMHLASGLQRAKIEVEIWHPIRLLSESFR